MMTKRQFRRIVRPATSEERARHAEIRRKVIQEFPPAEHAGPKQSPAGIPSELRRAREAQGLTWYAVAKLAGIPNPSTVRDIEYGRDVRLSNLEAVAKALGLRLELVEENA